MKKLILNRPKKQTYKLFSDMKINVIATGSSGNLYELLDKEGNSMIIEAGKGRDVFFKYRIGKEKPPEMCIISHKHSDHYKYWGEYAALMPTFVSKTKNVSENFKAFGFPIKHGEINTMTFLIKSLVEEKFLYFATDIEFDNENGEIDKICQTLNYYKVENFLIECNYNDYLFHLASEEQRIGCSRHLSDNDVIRFVKRTKAKSPKIITIHGSNRLSADSYTKKYISSKIISSTVFIAVGAKGGQKDLFII